MHHRGDLAHLVALKMSDEVPTNRARNVTFMRQLLMFIEKLLHIVLADVDDTRTHGRRDDIGRLLLRHAHNRHLARITTRTRARSINTSANRSEAIRESWQKCTR